MKNKKLLCFTFVVLINSVCFGQWISLEKNSLPDSKPIVQLVSDDISGTVIKIELTGFRIKEFSADGQVYQSIGLGSIGINSEVGMPDIPYIAKILAIPDQGTVDVEVLETSKPQTISGINLPPVRESWSEGKPETPYIANANVYNSETLYPRMLAKVEDPVIFRDFRLTRVAIFPIRYSPAKKEIEVIKSITVKIKYGGGLGINPKLNSKKPIAPSFAKLYRSIIFNYKEVLQREYGGVETGYDVMICIMPDSFATNFQTYADWNHKTGTFIHITKFSEIGASGSNPTPIKDYLLSVYNSWLIPPTHVLLVGDAGVAPVKYITLDGWTFVYDDYFVELIGNDFFPEMMIGRFTHQGNYRMKVMINKFIGYEKTPDISDPNWFRKALVCSNNAYASQIETKRFTAQELLVNGNFISVDSMYNGYPCPGNVNDIVNMINAGRGWLNYRGEGWYDNWSASCFPFSTSNVNSLSNGTKLTFVTSIGCGVANFDYGSSNHFGEAWVEIGDEFAPRGGCAFIGPVSNTHTAYNNEIDIGIYTGMFEEGLDSPGEALLRGKFHMYEVFGGSDPYVNYHYKIYHVLGDPTLHIWKDTPRNVNVSYTDTVNVGLSQCNILVTDAVSGLPVANALVCISGDSVYEISHTQSNGTAIINVNTQSVGELNITVSGGNVIPFEGTIQVVENTNTFQLTVNVVNGWNMVSVPGTNTDGMGVNIWWAYRNMEANVFQYLGGYQSVTETAPGTGYWMKHSGDRIYNTGDEWPAGGIQIVSHDPIAGALGWNLFGGYETSVATSGLITNPPGLINSLIYKYSSGGYQVVTTIDPGYGYWVKLAEAGQIIIPEAMAKRQEQKEYFPEDWGRIVMIDAKGTSYTLYAIKGEVNLSQYELPPAPLQGMFDIRFSSGRIAEDINSSVKTIDMSGVTYPLTVKAENMDIRLMDETGKIVNVNLKKGKDIVINNPTIQKLMVLGELIPDKYALGQNYPNPFNPSTIIEFSLPENVGNVKLTIYNTLGEKVAELVNTSLVAGKYSYIWNAQNIATGMYIYELRTDKFVSVKKMLLMK